MLKKAVLISAVAVAGVVALTPLAFAHEASGHDATTNVSKDNQSVDCDFQNNQATTGAGGVLGLNVGIPVNATIPIASCDNFNVSDVVDAATNNPNTEVATTR